MRLLFLTLLLTLGTAARAADEPPPATDPLAGAPEPLAEAIRQYGRDANRWAYTQRRIVYNGKGRVQDETLVRYDPSQPDDVQWTLLQRDGQPATEAQVKKHRKDMAKRVKDRMTLGQLLELSRATVTSETATDIIYEVPLRKGDNQRLPPEKFQVFVHVVRAKPALALIEVKLRSSWRVAGVVKVKAGDVRLEFASVLPEFTPPLARIAAEGNASVLLVPLARRAEATRTDFKRVTPYNERLKVKLGPLQLLDF